MDKVFTEVFSGYGKIFWEDWKGLRVQQSLFLWSCLIKNLYLNVLYLDISEGSHTQHAQHSIHSSPNPLVLEFLSQPQSTHQGCNGPRLAAPSFPPTPPHATTILTAQSTVTSGGWGWGGHLTSPVSCGPLNSREGGQLSASLTPTISKWVLTETPPHQPFPLWVSSPHCCEIAF